MSELEPRNTGRLPAQLSPKSFAFTILLGLFAALPALSIDLSAPTLPFLPHALRTTVAMAGLTLTLFMVGFALGQYSAGIFSDARGRRPVLLGGLACFTLAGAVCSLSQSALALVASRGVQGFGAGCCSVISFAMVQDLFDGEVARAKRSYVMALFTAMPIIAPALGSVLVDHFGWRSVHMALAAGGGCLLAVSITSVPETRRRAPGYLSLRGGPKRQQRSDAVFIRASVANALSYGAIFTYIAGSPVVIVGQMGYRPSVFAAVFACTAVALALGAATNGLLGRRGTGAAAAIWGSLIVTVFATLGLAVAGLTGISVIIIWPLLLVVLFCRGILAPNWQHVAIERRKDQAGNAVAFVGVWQLLAGAGASIVVAILLPILRLNAVLVPMAVLATAAWLTWRPVRW